MTATQPVFAISTRFTFLRLALTVMGLLFAMASQATDEGQPVPDCINSLLQAQHKPLISPNKIVYIDFWASWCGPCVQSFPFLNQIQQEFKDQDLIVIGVNQDEEPLEISQFIATHPAGFEWVTDAMHQCAKDFDVKAMPSSFIVDRNGRIHHIHLGFKAGEAAEIKQLITQLISHKTP